MSLENLEQLLLMENSNDDDSSSSSMTMQKYGSCIEEFNANISFGNSIRWCKDENYIALMTNSTVYIKNVSNDKRGTIVLYKELEDGAVTSQQQEPNRTSIHLKDRTIIHPSMFVRFLPSSFRSISWSSPIENYETFEITNEIGCLISCVTSDNNCRIYKRPTQGFTTNWELVCDVRAILQSNDKILFEIEKENQVNVTPQGIISSSSLGESNNIESNNSNSNSVDSVITNKKKTRTHTPSKKSSTVASFEAQFFSHFYKLFIDASGFDPSKEEYQVGYRKWTDEEQKIYEKSLESALEFFKPQIQENSLSTEGLTKNLYVKLRTKMRKDKSMGKVDVAAAANSSSSSSTPTTTTTAAAASTKASSSSSSSNGSTNHDASHQPENNPPLNLLVTREQKKRKAASTEPQPKKVKRLYFTRGIARENDEKMTQKDYIHCLYLSEILCSDFSQPFKKVIDGSQRQSLYIACGSKTGFLSTFVITNSDRKLQVELVGYSKIFSNFVSFTKFLPTNRPGEDFFRLVTCNCEGNIKFFTIPKSYNQSVENADDLITPTEICTEYASYFESDSIPLTSLESLYVPSSQSKNTHDELYVCYSKGTNLFVCRFEFQSSTAAAEQQQTRMVLTWKKKLSCQDFTISSISLQYISIDQSNRNNETFNTLLVYTTSLDGSLVQWKINLDENNLSVPNNNQNNDNYTSVYIISKNCELPVWGISLSPNSVQASISVERPPTKEVRADLEHRNKMRIYILSLFQHALRAIYHIPQTCPIPSHCIVDYFTTLLSRGLFNNRKQQVFDIANCLSSSDMVEYSVQILANVNQIAIKNNNLPLKKVVYFLYSKICSEMDHPSSTLRETLMASKYDLEQELRYIYSVSLLNIQINKMTSKHQTHHTPPSTLTTHLLCDWILLYYQQFISRQSTSSTSWSSPHIIQQAQQYLPVIDSIIKTLQQSSHSNSTTNEEQQHRNTKELNEIQFAQKLLVFFSRIVNECHAGLSQLGQEIIMNNNNHNSFITTPRDTCPVCKPSSEERFVPMVFGDNFAHSTCCSPRRHPIARDVFTFEIIRDVYQTLECSCCCQQTSRDGLFSLLNSSWSSIPQQQQPEVQSATATLFVDNNGNNNTTITSEEEAAAATTIGQINGGQATIAVQQQQQQQSSEGVIVDEELMNLLCPSHKDHVEACSFKIECCMCGSSFNANL